jgi:hypothetical protein
MAAKKRLYELDDAARAQFAPWRDKWIANAMSTKKMDAEDREATRQAVIGLYEAAKLTPPKVIVWVSSPMVAHFACAFAAALIETRKRGRTRDATRAATEAATWAATEAATRDAATAATRAATRAATADVAWAATEAATWAATEAATRDAASAATRAAATAATGDADTLQHPWYSPIANAFAKLATELGGPHANILLQVAASGFGFLDGGNQWSGYPAYLSFFRHIAKIEIDYSKWQHYEAAALHSGPRYMHADFCIVADRPEVLTVDNANRPHNEAGPFCRWRDGISLYAIHGVRVPAYIVERPDLITVARIQAETNEEVRRVMIERYGLSRYVRDAGFDVIDADTDPIGQPRRLLRRGDMLVVELTNSTVDADGARRVYHVPCHPELRPMLDDSSLGDPQKLTALNAVASSYGMRGEEYDLAVET